MARLIIDGIALRPKAIELQEALRKQGWYFSNAERDRLVMECKAKNSAQPLLERFKFLNPPDPGVPAMSEAEAKKVLGAAIRDSHYAKLADGLLRTGFSQSV